MNLEMSIQKAERDVEEYKITCDELKQQQAKLNEMLSTHSSELEIKMQLNTALEEKISIQMYRRTIGIIKQLCYLKITETKM